MIDVFTMLVLILIMLELSMLLHDVHNHTKLTAANNSELINIATLLKRLVDAARKGED